MKIIFLSIIINFIFCNYSINKYNSEIKYFGVHPLHEWSGTSSSISMSAICNEDNTTCDLIFSLPIISLNSGNDNRDSNMLNHLNAFIHPEIILEKKQFIIQEYNNKSIEFNLTINGKTKKTNIPLTVKKKSGTKYLISSTFDISLSNFEVTTPKLLFIPIKDKIKISAELMIEKR